MNKGTLYLNGLVSLSDEQAKSLSQHDGSLYLSGLTSLSDEAAKSLSQHKGDFLCLNGLIALSDEAAKSLSRHNGDLYLNGITTLSDEAAKALSQHNGDLYLNGVTTLSDEAAKALTQHQGDVHLNGLATRSEEVGKALTQCKPPIPAPELPKPTQTKTHSEQSNKDAVDLWDTAAKIVKIHDGAAAVVNMSSQDNGQKNLNRMATGIAIAGALVGGPGVLLVAPILWGMYGAARRFAENADSYPLGPDGRPTNRGCGFCGAPMSMGCFTCARCGRKHFG